MLLKRIHRRFSRMWFRHHDVVRIEGGLGSQILGLMQYEIRKRVNPRTQVDVSYFYPVIDSVQTINGLARRPWALDGFGIELSDFSSGFAKKRLCKPSYRVQASRDLIYYRKIMEFDWNKIFPVPTAAVDRLGELGLEPQSFYACVHLRQGDYLNVSSRVIGFREPLALCVELQALLPRVIVFVTDDEFTAEQITIARAKLPSKNCIFLIESDAQIVHGIMRMANVLVTANSTFSWSAAVLKTDPNAIAFSPQHFFSPEMAEVNSLFQAPAKWMLLGLSE